jgi:ferredoxin-NADP reductase
MPPIHFQVTVSQVIRHSSDVATYLFTCEGRRPRFRPGQFIHIALDDYDPSSHWPDSRAFSIASSPGADHLRLTVSRQGRFTSRILDTLTPGRRLWCKGPYGEFEVRVGAPEESLVLIAGGTGITPFSAFMEDALARPTATHVPVTLYYGARRPDLLVHRDLAERWQQAVADARVFLFAEQPEDASDVHTGRLDIDHIAAAHSTSGKCRYYLSEPKLMIQSFRERLTHVHAVPQDIVMMDAWE